MNILDKDNLYSIISFHLYENRHTKKITNSLLSTLFNRVSSNKIIDIVKGSKVHLSSNELYWLGKDLEKLGYRTDYLKYFTEQEVSEAENYLINKIGDNKKTNEVVIEGVIQLKDDEYLVPKMPYRLIAEYYEKGIMTYNYDSQREGTLIDIGIGIVLSPTTIKEAIDEMAEKMIVGNFFSNTITWNILATGQEKFDFDGKSKLKFIKDKGSDIDIIDGYHRTLAIIKALSRKPELADEFMQVKILNYDINKAGRYIYQETKGTSFSEEKKKSISPNNYSKVVEYLNKSGTSILRDKISVIDDEVFKYNSKYVMFSTIVDTLSNSYKEFANISMQSEINNFNRHMEKIFNNIMTYFDYEFNNIKNEKSIFTNNSMFIGYTWLALQIERDDRYWEEKIYEFLDTIKNNPNLIKFNVETKRNDVKFRKMVIDNFNEIWNGLSFNKNFRVIK